MAKKILIILLVVILVAAGAGGTIYFYLQNKNQIEQNQLLTTQNTTIQQQLNAIGTMTSVYEVSKKCYSGKVINESDLIEVSVPTSTLGTASITDKTQIIGRCWRVDINPGTVISADMLMDESEDGVAKFTKELTFTTLPVTTKVGDYVDLRIILPNGEEYVILNHKRIERLYEQTITIFVSEEENTILHSAIADKAMYYDIPVIYLTKYLEPGNSDSLAFYPVSHDVENFIKWNPNIDDATRCVNPTLRDHIDEVLTVYTSSNNKANSQAFAAAMNVQFASQLAAHQDWIMQNTDEEGNVVITDDTITGSGSGAGSMITDGNESGSTNDTAGNFDQAVGEAYDSLDQSIEDLEAIQ